MPTPVIPESKSRTKRKVFGFVGDLTHTLFGTATSKEVNNIVSHVLEPEDKNQRLVDAVAKSHDDLSTSMTLSGNRYNNLRNMSAENHMAIIALRTSLLREMTRALHEDVHFNVLLLEDILSHENSDGHSWISWRSSGFVKSQTFNSGYPL